ncbi:hypothetical protein ACQPYK_50110 (plasmid) [Streptosporangium sp. CA-135522]
MYMRVTYTQDQNAEWVLEGRLVTGEQAQPTSQWRWLEYGPVGNRP